MTKTLMRAQSRHNLSIQQSIIKFGFPNFVDQIRSLRVLLLSDEPPRALWDEGVHEHKDHVDQSCKQTEAVPVHKPFSCNSTSLY